MNVPAKKLNQTFTYDDYLTWDDGERWELIHGVPYNMTPAPSRGHQEISGNIFNAFFNFLKGKSCKVYHAAFDVILSKKNVVQPDIVVVCDPSKLTDRGCEGTPDLVVEILSPSTTKKDLNEKFQLYQEFGVKEYWVVFPLDKQVHIYRLNEHNEYADAIMYKENATITTEVLPELVLEMSDIFA